MKLKKEDYSVITGPALVLHGVKDLTSDIDLVCSCDKFEALIIEGFQVKVLDEGSRYIILDDNVDIYDSLNVDDFIIIEGYYVASLNVIKEHKRLLGRAKDFQDIRMIDDFLSNSEKSELKD